MAIADLLWACPRCGRDRGLRSPESARGRGRGRDAVCTGCGTRFDRVRGARIRARTPGESEDVRTAAAWVDDLPDPTTLLQRDPVRTAAVAVRFVERWDVVRAAGAYVNRIEIFGEEADATLELRADRLICRGAGETPVVWAFGALRAVQASSRSLQINGAPHPLASFSFPDDASFLWERLLALTLGAWYRRTGRGEVVELQPRIATR